MPTVTLSPSQNAEFIDNSEPWTNAANAYASDDSNAECTATGSDGGSTHRWYDFGAAIPAGATIDAIRVLIECWQSGTTGEINPSISYDGTAPADTATTYYIDIPTGAEGTITGLFIALSFPGSVFPTPTQINSSDFSVCLRNRPNFGVGTNNVDVDHVQLEIDYTLSGSAPDPMTGAMFSVATGAATGGQIDLTISSLPGDGGSPLTDLEYDVDGSGTWISLGSVTTGTYPITMAAPSTSYSIRVRAVNAIGNGGASPGESATSSGPSLDPTPAFRTQHFSLDVGTSGATQAITPVSSLNNAIALNNNSRRIGAGPDGNSSNIAVNEASLGIRLTSTSQVALDREASVTLDNRAYFSVAEYIGAPGGPNEMIVRDRRSITISAGETSVFTPSGFSNAAKLVPIVTGVRHTNTSDGDHSRLNAATQINRTTGEVTVHSRGSSGTAVVEVTTIELTGSNWTVHYGTVASLNDTGTITLSGSVASWANALIIDQFFKSGGGVNDALADVCCEYYPGAALNQVDWQFDGGHDGSTGQFHTVYVLENADMSVTRFTSTDSSAGAVNIDITSAGLTALDEALIFVSSRTSGGGTAHLRGTRAGHLTSLTNAQHYCHRSGNTMSINMQIVRLPQDPAPTGATATLSAQETGVDVGAAAGSVSVETSLSGQDAGTDAGTGSAVVAVRASMSAQGGGSDTANATAGVTLSATLAAQEVGADAFAATAVVTDPAISAVLSVQEIGGDQASGSAAVASAADLAAIEVGFDAAAGLAAVDAQVALAAQEAGFDTATVSSVVALAADFAVQETGGDTALAAAGVQVSGDLAAQEQGADTFSAAATVTDPGRVATLSAVEVGDDTASGAGQIEVSASLTIQEAGQDAFSGTASVEFEGRIAALAVQETGEDAGSAAALAVVSGSASVQETGTDTANASASIEAAANLGGQETGADALLIAATVAIAAILGVQEAGADGFSGTASVTDSGRVAIMAIQEVGQDGAAASATVSAAADTSAQEQGDDVASVALSVEVNASASTQESGDDLVSAAAEVAIGAALAAQEVGSDILSATARLSIVGETSIEIAGSWGQSPAPAQWAAHSIQASWPQRTLAASFGQAPAEITWKHRTITGEWE